MKESTAPSHTLIPSALPASPASKNGRLERAEAAALLRITSAELGLILSGWGADKASGDLPGQPSNNFTADREKLLAFILDGLWSLCAQDPEAVYQWLSGPKASWYGLSPLAGLRFGRLDAVKSLVERELYGEIGAS